MRKMKFADLLRTRLHNQLLASDRCKKAEDVVKRLGAVQAQDYAGAKWALAQRTIAVKDAAIEKAVADGTILRTHVMRPTWHFVTPDDIGWLLRLTAPRVNSASASYYRKMGLDDDVFAKSNTVLAKALKGGNQLMRSDLTKILEHAGIMRSTDDRLRFNLILMRAELDAVICSGARKGKQITYALLDERVPGSKRTFDRDEALANLANRYFTSHGPATLRDFMWWSGLSSADARAGLEMIRSEFSQELIDGKTFWFRHPPITVKEKQPSAHLLHVYDEYFIAYKDRFNLPDPKNMEQMRLDNYQTMVIYGRVVGTWRRTLKRDGLTIELNPFEKLSTKHARTFEAVAHRYSDFMDMPVSLRERSSS